MYSKHQMKENKILFGKKFVFYLRTCNRFILPGLSAHNVLEASKISGVKERISKLISFHLNVA